MNKASAELLYVSMYLNSKGIYGFNPQISLSTNWHKWVTVISLTTCLYCINNNQKIYEISDNKSAEIPAHFNCRCRFEALVSIFAGTATADKEKGADALLKYYKKLPDDYLTKGEAKSKGWLKSKGNLVQTVQKAIIGGDIYHNKNGRLPSKEGRVWYEADINYNGGYRGPHRIVYSNDGLIFVTYNHYETFYEII